MIFDGTEYGDEYLSVAVDRLEAQPNPPFKVFGFLELLLYLCMCA